MFCAQFCYNLAPVVCHRVYNEVSKVLGSESVAGRRNRCLKFESLTIFEKRLQNLNGTDPEVNKHPLALRCL